MKKCQACCLESPLRRCQAIYFFSSKVTMLRSFLFSRSNYKKQCIQCRRNGCINFQKNCRYTCHLHKNYISQVLLNSVQADTMVIFAFSLVWVSQTDNRRPVRQSLVVSATSNLDWWNGRFPLMYCTMWHTPLTHKPVVLLALLINYSFRCRTFVISSVISAACNMVTVQFLIRRPPA